MISIVIFSSLLGLAAPGFTIWLQNGHIRTAAEAILNGLQLARASAVQRNDTVYFQLTTTLNSSCALSVNGTSWVVSMDDPTRACGSAASETVAPRIVQSRAGGEGSRNSVIAADQSSIGFNGIGRRINAGSAAHVNLNVTNTTGGGCIAAGGTMRCLRVVVSASGQVRLCDPSVASPDTRACS